jgi:hypothetical protein
MFATGIENSAPTIDGGRTRRDQMAELGHYARWREDLALVKELGCDALRYGPQLHATLRGDGHHDWTFADETFAEVRRLGITPIVDLCHFGVPDWIGDFQNPDLPALFAAYAGAFARRFPWVQLYTPVNEMFITAVFSAKYGWWNEQRHDDRSYVTAIRNIVRANVLAMQAILRVRPDAIFVQSESTEAFHPECPAAIPHAEHRNSERFLTLDLNYGRQVDSAMYEYLLDNGMSRADYQWFMLEAPSLRRHCIMGNDWYLTNEHIIGADGHSRAAGEVFGYDTVTREYHARYRLPVMHTETNCVEGRERRRGRALAVEAVGRRDAPARRGRADDGLHLVFAAGPRGLGRRAARGPRAREPARALRPRPQAAPRRPRLQAADRGVAPGRLHAGDLPEGAARRLSVAQTP